MGGERVLLEKLSAVVDECVGNGGLVVAVLPTGYGKTSFVRRRLLGRVARGLRVAHVLPLRAIVEEAALRARMEAEGRGLDPSIIGYQAGLELESVDKSPYLARNYMVVTVDSMALSFYGVPVYEVFRDAWHSDAAYALARSFDLLILDEYHLMVSGDAGDPEGEAGLLAKQATVIADIIRDYLEAGRCVAILTATLPPSLLRVVAERVGVRARRVWLIGYGEPRWQLYRGMRGALEALGEAETIVERDEGFEGERCGCTETILAAVPKPRGGVVALDEVLGLLEGARSVFIAFNSWRRAVAAYREYAEAVSRRLGCRPLLLTGKMSPRQRRGVLEELREGERVCLFATQVVEAGVDLDFDALVTEAAPLPALVQRAGRVARHRKPGAGNRVVILYVEGDEALLARGVYDEDATTETLSLLRDALGGERGPLDWRCGGSGGCRSVWELLAVLDERLYSGKVTAAPADTVTSALEELAMLALPPRQALERIDGGLRGSFVRKSALIPLVPRQSLPERLDNVTGATVSEILSSVVTVDVGFVERHGECYLETRVERDGRVRVKTVVARRLGEGYRLELEEVALDALISKPLTSMWMASRKGSLLGFLLKRDAYDEATGLVPRGCSGP